MGCYADTVEREVFDAERRILGPEHRDTLATMSDLATKVEASDTPSGAESAFSASNMTPLRSTITTYTNTPSSDALGRARSRKYLLAKGRYRKQIHLPPAG